MEVPREGVSSGSAPLLRLAAASESPSRAGEVPGTEETTPLLVGIQKLCQNDACCELSNVPAYFIVVNDKYGMR